MSGRRSHPRFTVATPWDGAVRVLRDVVIRRIGPHELLAISQTPGLVGEDMTLDVTGGGASLGMRVKVLKSAPMIFNGAVRHRIRLALLDAAGPAAAVERPALPGANGPAAVEM